MLRFSQFLSGRIPFFYGYAVMLVALVAQICSSPGQTFAISAFTPHLQESLGLSSSALSAAYMLGTMLAALPLLAIGPLADRCGLRNTTLGVAIGLTGACLFASQVESFPSLVLAFLLLRFLGQGSMTLISGNIISMWFRQRLGTMNSIMSGGGALAFATIPIALIATIEAQGWRTTFVLLGVSVSLVLIPLSLLLLRNRPEDLGLRIDGLSLQQLEDRQAGSQRSGGSEIELTLGQAIRHRSFWILTTDMCLWATIGTGIVFHALPIFAEHGIPAEQSQLLFTTFSLSMLATQITFGILADRFPMHRLLAIGYLGLASGVCVIPFTQHWGYVHGFALLFGAGQGIVVAVNAAMWARYYGRRNLGKIRGTAWCATVAGSGCGPLILGLVSDQFDSFAPGLWLFVALLAPLVPLSLLATAPTSTTRAASRDLASQAA